MGDHRAVLDGQRGSELDGDAAHDLTTRLRASLAKAEARAAAEEAKATAAAAGEASTGKALVGVRVAQDRDLEAFSVYATEVLRLAAGGYRMYYAGWLAAPEVAAGSKYHGRIFSAFSDDGVDCRKDPDICIDNGGRWDAVKASEPCVIDLPDGRYRMFYEACDETGRWRIASATSGAA